MNWEENEKIIDQMIKGSTGELWGSRLEQTDHYNILSNLLEATGQAGSLIDVGCGAGDVSRVWKGSYIGVDLEWVIEKVAKVCNPGNKFIAGDATVESTIIKFPSADIILMNAFLDVLENPHDVFDMIMSLNINKIIVHRQRLTQDQASFETSSSYGGSVIPSSIMSFNKLAQSLQKFPNAKFALVRWQSNVYSFIVDKNEVR